MYITSREALGIKADSPQPVIAGNVVVKTIMPVTINAPVQGEVRILASPCCHQVGSGPITALANTVIKYAAVSMNQRTRLLKAAGVEVAAALSMSRAGYREA